MSEYKGLDENNPEHIAFLKSIQGNIVKSHGRTFTANIFIKFIPLNKNIDSIRKWIKSLQISTEYSQRVAAIEYRNGLHSDQLFTGFYLSASGYKALGISTKYLPYDTAFRSGMKLASSLRLSDPDTNKWDRPFQGKVDLLILLANNNKLTLESVCETFTFEIGKIIGEEAVLCVEWGHTLRSKDGYPIEHFGYTDGISQPLFYKKEIDDYFNINPKIAWDPSANPHNLAFANDPIGVNTYGSYLVFRKLEQNVKAFHTLTKELSIKLNSINTSDASAIGRFPNGTPLTLFSQESEALKMSNNFTYSNDNTGSKCPYHSHIRKMNPRTLDQSERFRRIIRRGIPYGDRNDDIFDKTIEDKPTANVGLLFMCFQQDITRQFEFLQRVWANNPNHPPGVGFVGLDPVSGNSKKFDTHVNAQRWPSSWDGNNKIDFKFDNVVKLLGGEYFFAPSMEFFNLI